MHDANHYLSRQRGSSLIIAMAVLLMVGLLAVAASRSLMTEQRVSANQNDRQFARQLAELALRDAEIRTDRLDKTLVMSTRSTADLFGSGKIFTENCTTTFAGAWPKGLCLYSSRTPDKIAAWQRTMAVSSGTYPVIHPCGNAGEYVYETGAGNCNSSGKVASGNRVWANPRYIVELVDRNARQGSTIGRMYRITAYAWGRNQNTQVALQSHFLVPEPTNNVF